MSVADLDVLNDTELLERLSETKQELFNLRFQRATGQLQDNNGIAMAKKDVARILTVLRQREIALAEGGKA